MELNIWSGDWGLPSIDPPCLSAVAYCKFTDAKVNIKKTNNPWWSPSGDLPVLKCSNSKETKLAKIFKEFYKQNDANNEVLTAEQSADTMAFALLVEEKLLPALLHLWWVDTLTFTELTRPWYAKAVGFPFSLYFPQHKHNKVIAQLNAPFACDQIFSESDLENQVIRNAKECLNLLSVKLGNNNYFFNDRPTELDAIVFGHLAPLLQMPLSNPLQAHLKACRNLVIFCQKILAQYFPLSPEERAAQQNKEEMNKQQDASDAEFPHRKRNIFLGGLTALVAFAAYAVMNNIVQIKFVKDDGSANTIRREKEFIRASSANGDREE